MLLKLGRKEATATSSAGNTSGCFLCMFDLGSTLSPRPNLFFFSTFFKMLRMRSPATRTFTGVVMPPRGRSPATRTFTGVVMPPRGVKPKNLSCNSKSWWKWLEISWKSLDGDWETLKGFERIGMLEICGDISGHQELLDG